MNNTDQNLPRYLKIVEGCLLLFWVALFLFASWFRSRNHIFWSDEIMGWLVLRQDSWPKLLHVWNGGIDSSGIAFYILARPWVAFFGASENTLRSFSAMGVALSFVFTWLGGKKLFSLPVVAISIPLVYLSNQTLIWQLANGRTYGVLLAAVALMSYAMLRTTPSEPEAANVLSLVITLLASTCLVGSHILGILYCGSFVVGFLARDLWLRVFRPTLYVAALSGFFLLPISWSNIMATSALGKPHFWTPRPTFIDLLRGFYCYSTATGLAVAAALLLCVIAVVLRGSRKKNAVFSDSKISLYFLFGVFALLAVTMFCVSQITASIFVPRYLLPMIVGDALLICELLSLAWDAFQLRASARSVIFAVSALLLSMLYIRALRATSAYPQLDYTQAIVNEIPIGEPVVVTQLLPFSEIVFYHNSDRKFFAPIDADVQLSNEGGAGGPVEFHMLTNLKAFGFYPGQILTTQDILRGQAHFVVLSTEENTAWIRRYILSSKEYRAIELLPHQSSGFGVIRLWQVDVL